MNCSVEWHFFCQSNANIMNNYVVIKSTIQSFTFHPFCFQTADFQPDEGLMDILVSGVVLYNS